MGQEDFLERQFDQLGRVMARILAKLRDNIYSGDASRRIAEVSRDFQKELGYDLFHLVKIPDDDLIALFREEAKIREKNIDLLAEILYELADYLDSTGHDETLIILLYSKSIYLHEFLHTTGTIFSFERQSRIDEIRDRLTSFG